MLANGAHSRSRLPDGTYLDGDGTRELHIATVDPGYLAPQGVTATVRAGNHKSIEAVDLVTGARLSCEGNGCTVQIDPGTFRVLEISPLP